MPRTRSLAFAELRIGILGLAAMVITAIVIFTLSGQGGFFWQRYPLNVRFLNVAGLKAGAPVRLAGLEVGSVETIELVGTEVSVDFTVSRAVQPRITDRSEATLGSISLLGQSTVDITAATEGTPIPDGGTVRSGQVPTQIADVAATANKGLDQATRLLQDVRGGRGLVGRLFTDDDLYEDLRRFVRAAEEVTVNLSKGRGTAGKLISDPALFQSLERSLTQLETITGRINAGEGSLGRLLKSNQFAESLTSATGNIDAVTAKLASGEGTAGKLVNDATLYNRLNSLADWLDLLTTRLNQGEGTAGQLLQDRQLYENMNGVANELRSLVTDIRKDPRKFLSVKVSIF